jgi:hypothetical protein
MLTVSDVQALIVITLGDAFVLNRRVRQHSDVPRTVARALSTHPDASQILLDAALDPRGNDKLIWPHCDGLFWLHPRVDFHGVDGWAGCRRGCSGGGGSSLRGSG